MIFEGRRVLFASEEELKSFTEDPGRFFPTLAGLDLVLATRGEFVAGDAKLSIVYKNRLYVMSSVESRDAFLADPASLSDVDVTLDGVRPVTLAEQGERVAGAYNVSTIFLGRRFLFANDDCRRQFALDPPRYAKIDIENATASR